MHLRQNIINQNTRYYLDKTSYRPKHFNQIRQDYNCNHVHEDLTARICNALSAVGGVFLCQARLKDGKRPDIIRLDIDPPIVYEIVDTEPLNSIIIKKSIYPIEIVLVNVDNVSLIIGGIRG